MNGDTEYIRAVKVAFSILVYISHLDAWKIQNFIMKLCFLDYMLQIKVTKNPFFHSMFIT